MASSRKQSASVRLDVARSQLAATEQQMGEVEKARADAILADSDDSARKLDIQLETLRRDSRIARDRVGLLEAEAAKEAEEKRLREQAALIRRIEAKIEQRDKVMGEVADAIQQLATASEKAMKLGREIAAAWAWPAHDLPVALLSPPSIMTAISHESFRISYHPRRYGGLDADVFAGMQLPGSRAPTLQLLENPSGVRPMMDVVADATAFAKSFLHTGRGSASMNGVQQQQTVADSLGVPPVTSGDTAPVQYTEAAARLAYLLKQQAVLSEDITPAGEEAYAACVAEIVEAQAAVSAEQRSESQ
jgi:hypothetical protein